MFHQPLNPYIANIMLGGVTMMIESLWVTCASSDLVDDGA